MLCTLDWGPEGLLEAVRREDIVVLVDVLRFCSTAVAAVRAGVRIIPALGRLEAEGLAAALKLPVVSSSKEGYEAGKPTDSPLWYQRYAVAGTRVVYPSSNGGRLLSSVRDYPYVVLGALLNASAAARYASALAGSLGKGVTVVAAGELSTDFDPESPPRLLFAAEDLLGAGAVIDALSADLSAEATVALGAWESCVQDRTKLLLTSWSGRHLQSTGRQEEVEYCAQLDVTEVVPILRHGEIVAAEG
ncbi:conserved hypothetical protein [Thermobaculum terrenum ATCC BAA-798]|uniref:Probable 2-phosphosulfolactate phosphatase n=1 Tax=Thermobaculum terrenum (strain ATCC BAA-798 / CCMEE 7001 / YNP1) TaxID=525904 RepID=D1CH58_THET1|nr:2-phosphosulfolactate phosphatase [Thermobaculum terrenum]ACZ43079.1 conserved hypothetical protein [Thermobaculum terrenum ATCC BAA-798]